VGKGENGITFLKRKSKRSFSFKIYFLTKRGQKLDNLWAQSFPLPMHKPSPEIGETPSKKGHSGNEWQADLLTEHKQHNTSSFVAPAFSSIIASAIVS
jgi:hypothetical protein